MVKDLSAMQETQVQPLGGERPPGERNANLLQYSCLEDYMEPGGLQFMGLQRVRYD